MGKLNCMFMEPLAQELDLAEAYDVQSMKTRESSSLIMRADINIIPYLKTFPSLNLHSRFTGVLVQYYLLHSYGPPSSLSSKNLNSGNGCGPSSF